MMFRMYLLTSAFTLSLVPGAHALDADAARSLRAGSVTEAGGRYAAGHRGGFDAPGGSRYAGEGRSISHYQPIWPGSEGAPYGTSGTGAMGPSVIQINVSPDAGLDRYVPVRSYRQTGAKIIDVESARLDRRPYGEDGLDIVYSGTTKIIRVSPDYRAASGRDKDGFAVRGGEDAVEFAKLSPSERAVTVYPDPDLPVDVEPPRASLPDAARVPVPTPAPTASPAPAPEEAPVVAAAPEALPAGPTQPAPSAAPAQPSAGFEPWTDEWLRDCVRRYPNFDASLGTYADESGRRRFCTGDPAS